MRYRCRRSGTVPLCCLLLLLITAPVQAADCGDAVAACGCGDRVIVNNGFVGNLAAKAKIESPICRRWRR